MRERDMDLTYLACRYGVENRANLYYENDGGGNFTVA
jgi:hypothetical protein